VYFKYINSTIILKYISYIYIFSLALHHWDVKSIRFSEVVFLLLIFIYFIGVFKKQIKIKFIKSDLYFGSFFLVNIFLVIANNFEQSRLLGLLVSFYLFMIYFIYRNLFEINDIKNYFKTIIYLSILSALLGILGWLLQQFEISTILARERSYPFSIGKEVRAYGFFTTPNLLAFYLIIGLNIFLSFKKNSMSLFYTKSLLLNLALLLTFSKSLVLYAVCLIINFYKKLTSLFLKYLSYLLIIFLILFHNFFTSFLLLDKSKDYNWLDNSYTPLNLSPLYENNNFYLYETFYTFAKIKSVNVIKDHYLFGVGYNNFKNVKNTEFPFLKDKTPHSTYLGVLSEYGIFGFLSILLIFLYSLKIATLNQNLLIIIVYFFLEGIHTDIITLKIIWIIFALIAYIKNKKIVIN
tara:strand:- start:11664 stop:12887 length:1224 start_codon:yes stop_codon:yes gene_type:complete